MKTKIPHSYVLLFYIIVAAAIASYFIPAGNFERQIDAATGINYVVPGSYHRVEGSAVSLFELFKAIPAGMMEASDIIIFVLITGGSFGIIQATGTINTLIGTVVRKYLGKEKKVIPIVMIMFSLAGAIFGTAEEALPLYPIFITLALALGFDSITGVAMVLLGTGSGFAAGFLNPFTTGIAQGISELPLFSGMSLRIIAYVVILTSSIVYVYWYAGKGNKDAEKEETIPTEMVMDFDINRLPSLSGKHIRVTIVLFAFLMFLIYGIISREFYILEISTTFLITGIASGIVGKLKPGRIASEFIKGASNLIYSALIIGLARAVMVIMIYGSIMDTVIYQLSKAIVGFTPVLSTIAMFMVQSIINLFITSGSGQAAVTMPIMTALADMSGVTRQTAVLAFQFGDGFSNVISPTSGYFMAALAIGGIQWKKWARWMFPLFMIWCILGCILLAIAIIIDYGPY